MAILKTLLLVAQILSALGVIGLVLLQHGKGADVGAAFGSGASGSLFGAATLALTLIGTSKGSVSAGVMGSVAPVVPAASAPAASAPVVPAAASSPAVPK